MVSLFRVASSQRFTDSPILTVHSPIGGATFVRFRMSGNQPMRPDTGNAASPTNRYTEKILSLYTDDCVYEDVTFGVVKHGKAELVQRSGNFLTVTHMASEPDQRRTPPATLAGVIAVRSPRELVRDSSRAVVGQERGGERRQSLSCRCR